MPEDTIKYDDIEWSDNDAIITIRVAALGNRAEMVKACAAVMFDVIEFQECTASVVEISTVAHYERDENEDE